MLIQYLEAIFSKNMITMTYGIKREEGDEQQYRSFIQQHAFDVLTDDKCIQKIAIP